MTNNEEKLNAKEEELRKLADRFEKQKTDLVDLERKQSQLAEEKSLLSEQLQAESELCAEAEEVRKTFEKYFVGLPNFVSLLFNINANAPSFPPKCLKVLIWCN